MRRGNLISILLLEILLASPAWGAPENWAIWVPTHAEYAGSTIGKFGDFYLCSDGYDLTGIDHIGWYCCWWGFLCTDDYSAFKRYQIRGDYYDCEGNLLEENALYWETTWFIVRGTGTVFSGGIGGRQAQPACYSDSPAEDCRVYVDMTPVRRNWWSCDSWPAVPPSGGATGKNLGRPRTCELAIANPINVATGNKYEEALDVAVSTPGIPLEFRRSYNSQSSYDGPLGYGWTHTYNIRLEDITPEGEPARRIVIWDGDGRGLYFTDIRKEADAPDEIRFAGESGVKDRLKQIESTGEYLLSRQEENLFYRFSPEGKLTEVLDLNGNRLTLSYETGRLSQVLTNFGKTLTFHYNSEGRIDWIKDPKGQTVSYSYDGGDLSWVSYPDGSSLGYSYSDHNLTDKYDTESNLIGHWDYDDKHKATAYYSHIKEGIEQERIDLAYGFLKTEVVHTSGLTTYTIQIKDGIYLVKEIEGCTSCGSVNKRFDYSERLDLVGVTSMDGQEAITTQFVYDNPKIPWEQKGRVEKKTEASGSGVERTTLYTYTYDPENPLLIREKEEKTGSVVSPGEEKTTRWTYDASGNLISKEETGYVMTDGVPTLTTYTTEYLYTDLGQLQWIDGPRTDVSDRTIFESYPNTPEAGDNRGQIRAIVNALGQRTEFSEYDANGNVGRIIDPNGGVTVYTYDERNRTKTITNPEEGVTEYFYDGRGNIAAVVLPEGNRITYAYDPASRLTGITDSLGNTILYEYGPEGNRIREETSDPDGVLQKYLGFAYDPYNRLKRIIHPDGTFTEYDHDGEGNRISVKDPNGNLTTYGYDALNRLTQVTQPRALVTTYGYDTGDNLTSVTDANGNRTDYRYDDFGRLIKTTSPDTGTTTYSYDEAGNLTQKTDARGTRVTYGYDALNRLVSVRFPDPSQDITYAYDSLSVSFGKGRLTGMADPSGSYTYHYDSQGNFMREEKEIAGLTYTTQYGYDKNNLLRSITYPSGRTVTYEIDEAGRVTRVDATLNGQPKTLASGIGYLPYGGIRELTYGNGLSLAQAYDLRYQIRSIEAGSALNLAYIQDPNGNITEITNLDDLTRSQTFGYDDIDRLVSATGIYGTLSYRYDPVGNRLGFTADGKPENYTYGPGTNKLLEVSGETRATFTYDPNGNTLSENERSYTYNPNNRLASVSQEGSKLADYVYNGAGQRVQKTTPGETRIFHYDLYGHLIAETDEGGKPLVEYVFLGDQPLAMIGEAELAGGGGGDFPRLQYLRVFHRGGRGRAFSRGRGRPDDRGCLLLS